MARDREREVKMEKQIWRILETQESCWWLNQAILKSTHTFCMHNMIYKQSQLIPEWRHKLEIFQNKYFVNHWIPIIPSKKECRQNGISIFIAKNSEQQNKFHKTSPNLSKNLINVM